MRLIGPINELDDELHWKQAPLKGLAAPQNVSETLNQKHPEGSDVQVASVLPEHGKFVTALESKQYEFHPQLDIALHEAAVVWRPH